MDAEKARGKTTDLAASFKAFRRQLPSFPLRFTEAK